MSLACHKTELNFDTAVTLYQQAVLQARRKDYKQAKVLFEQSKFTFCKVFKGQEKANPYIKRAQNQIDNIERQINKIDDDDFM